MKRHPQKGFSLIELATVVALIGVLLAVALPAITDWIATQRVRTAAEGVLNGLQLARGEAVRQNTLADLQIGADGISWNVVVNGVTVQTRGADAGGGVTVTASLDGATAIAFPSTVTFNGVGRVITPTAVPPNAFGIQYSSSVTGVRRMCVAILSNTPKMCDPKLTDTSDPRGCFVGGVRVASCPAPI